MLAAHRSYSSGRYCVYLFSVVFCFFYLFSTFLREGTASTFFYLFSARLPFFGILRSYSSVVRTAPHICRKNCSLSTKGRFLCDRKTNAYEICVFRGSAMIFYPYNFFLSGACSNASRRSIIDCTIIFPCTQQQNSSQNISSLGFQGFKVSGSRGVGVSGRRLPISRKRM